MATLRISKNFIYTNGLMLCLAILGFVARYVRFPEVSLQVHLAVFGVSLVMIASIWYFFKWLDNFLNKVYPYERSIPGRITVQIVTGMVYILLVRAFVFWWGAPKLPIHLDELFRMSTYAVYILLSIVLNLGFFANYFLHQWKTSIQRAERLEREKTQVQFDNLKNQLNPHFLFNALTSLNSLIFEDQQLASDFLQHLSKVYRYVLQHKEKGLVSLQAELDFIQSYVFLLETRFAEGLQIGFNIPDCARHKEIVPVTLQIVIENALKHNIINAARPLNISISADQNYLSVRNNLQPKKLIETSNKQGLENLTSLYKFISPNPIRISSNEESFIIQIPLV
ncbi:MAG: sensor histidine kinase [Adhaeribacter sp.]